MSGAPKFFAPRGQWSATSILLEREESHHALRALRMSLGDVLQVTDGAGATALCEIESVDDGRVTARVLEVQQTQRPRPAVIVYQGAAKGGKADGVIERVSQLGVSEVRVFESRRTVARWDARKRRSLDERWSAIARAAAKQSGSPFVVTTGPPLSWGELVADISRRERVLALWEEADEPLRRALSPEAPSVALVVGPEGGLERSEAAELGSAGARLVSLGPNVLRTENAALVAASIILWHHGLIG